MENTVELKAKDLVDKIYTSLTENDCVYRHCDGEYCHEETMYAAYDIAIICCDEMINQNSYDKVFWEATKEKIKTLQQVN